MTDQDNDEAAPPLATDGIDPNVSRDSEGDVKTGGKATDGIGAIPGEAGTLPTDSSQ